MLSKGVLYILGFYVIIMSSWVAIQSYKIRSLESQQRICESNLLQAQTAIHEAQKIKQDQQDRINKVEHDNKLIEDRNRQIEKDIKNETVGLSCESSLQWLTQKIIQFNNTYETG